MRYKDMLLDNTNRSIITFRNIIKSVPEDMWNMPFSAMPLWKHIYHALFSLDKWYINPERFTPPDVHEEDLNNLDVATQKSLSREQLLLYLEDIEVKLYAYLYTLTEEELLTCPPNCSHTRFNLILAQHRHLDMHIGMLMGFLVAQRDIWPYVLGIDSQEIDEETMPLLYP